MGRNKIVAVFIFAATLIFLGLLFSQRNESKISINPELYQAVFLTNSQVYFGKLEILDEDFFLLKDVYYLRAGTLIQTGGSEKPEIDLVKLGGELHAPNDQMVINQDNVIFYEDIGVDSEIMNLITKHKNNP